MKRNFECLVGPYSLNEHERIGIIDAEEWYKGIPNSIVQLYIRAEDFVVAKWSEFDDGQTAHVEGLTTIAICKELADAQLLYNFRINPNSLRVAETE